MSLKRRNEKRLKEMTREGRRGREGKRDEERGRGGDGRSR